MRAVSHRYRLWLWLAMCLAVLGCQRAGMPTEPTSSVEPRTPETVSFGVGESIPAMFEVTVDPVTMQASSRPLTARSAAGFQASQFDLDITKFQTKAQFDVQSVQFTPIGDVEVTFRHAHPWGPVDIAQPPSATNRADLGYTGRLLILADLAPADIPSHTFFTDVKANTELIRGADGYVQPGDLLAKSGFNANCFPYMLLADEAKDNRIGVSNGGIVTGNWDPAVGGWQRSNLGPTGDGWTGYDFIHAGQTIENSFVLNADELTSGPVTLQVALLIKYTEPKGVGGEVGRTLRLPPETVDVLQFAYRAPHAALDVSRVHWTDPYPRHPQKKRLDPIFQMPGVDTGAVTAIANTRDWDAIAPEQTGELSQQLAVEAVETGFAGNPVLAFDIPGLSGGVIQAPAPAAMASGLPTQEIAFDIPIVNTTIAPPGGDWLGLLRATDAGEGVASVNPHSGVDPNTLIADAARAVDSVTYLPLRVRMTPEPPDWQFALIDVAPGVGEFASMVVVPHGPGDADDRLVIAYFDELSERVKCARATRVDPRSPSDWVLHFIGADAKSGYGIDMEVTPAGGLAVAYREEGTESVRFAMAGPDPRVEADWTLTTIEADTGRGYQSICLSVREDGRPLVLYHDGVPDPPDFTPGSWLKLAQAQVAAPTGPSDWSRQVLWCHAKALGLPGPPPIATRAYPLVEMALIAGSPVVIYSAVPYAPCAVEPTGLYLAQATVPEPGSAFDWQTRLVTNGGVDDAAVAWPDLIEWNGSLWLQGYRSDLGCQMLYDPSLAPLQSGISWPDVMPPTRAGLNAPPGIVNGFVPGANPLSCFSSSEGGAQGSYQVARALIQSPRRSEDWHTVVLAEAGMTGNREQYSGPAATTLAGHHVFAFIDFGEQFMLAYSGEVW